MTFGVFVRGVCSGVFVRGFQACGTQHKKKHTTSLLQTRTDWKPTPFPEDLVIHDFRFVYLFMKPFAHFCISFLKMNMVLPLFEEFDDIFFFGYHFTFEAGLSILLARK